MPYYYWLAKELAVGEVQPQSEAQRRLRQATLLRQALSRRRRRRPFSQLAHLLADQTEQSERSSSHQPLSFEPSEGK